MWSSIKRYLANCNLHGTRYLVEDDIHWTERVFWLITCILCWWGCIVMINLSLDSFFNQSVAFTVESTYLNWQTDFPSISVCTRAIPKSLTAANSLYTKKYGPKIKPNSLWRWLFSGFLRKPPKNILDEFSKLTSADIISLYDQSILNCTELMSKCYWNGKEFDCCEEFKPLQTAAGRCLTFNSKQTEIGEAHTNRFTMNKNNGVGIIHIGFTSVAVTETFIQIQVYVHNNFEIPTAVTFGDREIYLKSGRVVSVYVKLRETFNDVNLKNIPAKRRGCRMSDEKENLKSYRRYSNDGCLVEVQMESMVKHCGCVSHLFPRQADMPICNYTGLQCLHHQQITEIGKKDSMDRCLPDCEGSVLRIYQNKYVNGEAQLFKVSQGIHVELLALPTLRYKRYVVRSLLDLVVAVGSTVSLFMGAGILSVVEIPYWLLLRHKS